MKLETLRRHPSVSVIITCYNYGRFLKECLESVLTQTVQDVEVIVVNDGSTDETESVCQSFGDKIQYLVQPNRGLAEALNAGIRASRGDFFYFLSADDKLFPGALEKQLKAMARNPDCAVVCGNAKLIDESGNLLGDSIIPFPRKKPLLKMLGSPNLHDGSLLFRRSSLEGIGALYFDPSLGNYHIYHFKCFLLARRFRIDYLNEFLVYQRVHPNSMSHSQNVKKMIAGYDILRKEMRRQATLFDFFDDLEGQEIGEIAKAHYKLGTLFFLFGQYETAYEDFKKAYELDRHIFDKPIDISELDIGPFLFPLSAQNLSSNKIKVDGTSEGAKGPKAEQILSYLREGNIVKAFFRCQEERRRRPGDSEPKYLLAKVYLRQLQFHDSVNRFHEVTLKLLQDVQQNDPFHSIDLYLWLSFLEEEKQDQYMDLLMKHVYRLKFYDINEMYWAVSNALVMRKKGWIEKAKAVFQWKNIPLAIPYEISQPFRPSPPRMKTSPKRILFINPPYRRFIGLEPPCYPLSLGYMATLLQQKGYEVGIFDADYDPQLLGKGQTYEYILKHQHCISDGLKEDRHAVWVETKEMIKGFQPDLIGITAMSNKYPMVEKIAAMTKSLFPDVPVVIGGHHPSLYGERLLRNRNIDFVVRGEGEITMLELTERVFARNQDFSKIKGLLYREKGEIRMTPPRELIEDLDQLPIPNRELMVNPHYFSGNNVMTARGCPFQCSYCGSKVMWGRRVRRRSVEKVIEEIRGLIQRSGSRSISFWDDSFTLDRDYLRQLTEELRRIGGVTFSCITRLDLVDREILKLLKEAGCHQILFGVESGSERILASIQKGMNKDFIRKKVEEVRAIGIPWLGFFIMGYPGETKEDILETLEFLKELAPPAAEINLFNPLPGTPIWDELERKGQVHPDMDFSQYSQSSLKNYFLSDLNQEEFETLALKVARAFDEHNQQNRGRGSLGSGLKRMEVLPHPTQDVKEMESRQPISPPSPVTPWPQQVHFLMIDQCNAKCIFCGGDYFHSDGQRRITLDKFQKMASNLKLEHVKKIVLAGWGDPLLNPDFLAILHFAHQHYPNLLISVTTNGIALTEQISEALLEVRVSDLNISINAASQEVYRRLMQVDGFNKVCENARRFVSLRRKRGGGPILQFSAAINRLNIEELPALVELGREIGIDSINVFYTRFYPERIRHLNVEREEDRLRNEESLFYHREISDRMVEKAKSLAREYGIYFFHEPLFKEPVRPRPCVWPETQLMVGFDGEIYPCGGAEVHFREKVEGGTYVFGNVLKEPLETFWDGETYQALRYSSKNVEEGIFPECRVCANRMNPAEEKSHLMAWEDADKGCPKKGEKKNETVQESQSETGPPLVSVIVPTFNRPDRLVEALRSILQQTYPNFEIIVVNDAGTEVENLVSSLNSSGKITYIKHGRNRGLAAARNTGIKLSKGTYIAYLDDDDLYYPDHLETLVRFLKGSPYKVAYTDAHRAYQKRVNGRYAVVTKDIPYSFDFDYDRILVDNFVPVLCFMHEKSCLDEVGYFDEDLTTQEDWDLWIRLSRKFKFAHIKKVTCEFSWRDDGTTMTSQKAMDFLRNRKKIYEKYRAYSQGKPAIRQAQESFVAKVDPLIQQEYGRVKHNLQPDPTGKGIPTEDRSSQEMGLHRLGQTQEGCRNNLVSVIVLVHNQLEFTKKCLDSVFRYTNVPFELIVVDNGSTDGTADYLKQVREGKTEVGGHRLRISDDGEVFSGPIGNKKKKGKKKATQPLHTCKRFKVIHNGENLGFAGGNNRGIAEARGNFILLMNNDVVVTPGWLKRMIAVAEKIPEIGVVGPMSNHVFGPQRVEKIDYHPTSLSGLNQFAQDFAKKHQGHSRPFWRVVGFCMLIKKAVIDCIGGLDERFGLGNFEDDDFSLRAGLAGFESWIAQDCFVHHFGNKTFEGARIDYRESLIKNWEIFKRKWGISQEIAYGSPLDLTQILRQSFSRVKHYYPLKPEEFSLSHGEGLFQSGDIEGAKVIFNRLLRENPDHVDVLNNLGVISFQEGEIDQAIAYFQRGLNLKPHHPELLENLSQCLFMKGDYTEAKQFFEKAIALRPDSLSLLNSFGHCLIQAGDYSRAEEIYNKSYLMDETQKEVREILAGLEQLKTVGTERRVAL